MIAIYGHPTRGKEVIEILKNLGGNQGHFPTGMSPRHLYYIDGNTIKYTSDSNKDQFDEVFTFDELDVGVQQFNNYIKRAR